MSLILTPAEVVELTDRQRAGAQARRLRELGIPHLYTKGKPVKVLRSAVDRRAGTAARARRDGYAPEPNYAAFERR